MEIAVFLSGTNLSNGLDTPSAGEGRWGAQLAKMLAQRGYKVDCYVDRTVRPSWGKTTPLPNVSFKNRIDTSKQYDIALYTPWEHQYNRVAGPWEPCTTIPLRSKWYVHCTFSWAPSIENDHTCYDNNHVLAFPYIQEGGQFPPTGPENSYKVFPLPLPIFEELAPLNVENRKNILWSTKDVFHPDWGSLDHHVPRIGLATLRAIKKLAEKHSFETHFLSTRFFHPQNSWIGRDLEVMKLAKSIPNSHLHELLPRDQLMRLMGTVRTTTIVSGLLGSFGESIVQGAVPLCYSGHIYRAAAKKHNLLLDVFHATEEEIYDCLERLYGDDDFYSRVIKDYQQEMSYYQFDKAYTYFEAMVNELF